MKRGGMEWGNEAESSEGPFLTDLLTRERTLGPFNSLPPQFQLSNSPFPTAHSPILVSKPQPSTCSWGPFALYCCPRKYFVEHSLCHNPLDIVGVEGGVLALLWAGVVHRKELKHTHASHQDLKARVTPSHPLLPKLQGSVDAPSPAPPWGPYLHIHDATGLRGCEPEDLESKRREASEIS